MLTEDLVMSPRLLRYFSDAGRADKGDGRFYGLILRDDMRSVITFHPISPQLVPMQALWAGDMLHLLNVELSYGGAWVVVFTHPVPSPQQCIMSAPTHCNYERYHLIWVDEDGDPHVDIEWEAGTGELRKFVDVMKAGPIATAQLCEAALQTWFEKNRMLEAKPEQTFKRARGERAPSHS